ncbi:hypothetical protein [Pantoea anthophila]|uniref:CopG family transcriptional regulator n=1 Tax=Pantoea anthophila TaxID=470931 RepID=A0ABY2ZBM9_9GAMM|nr:hypothetical protein [Pantoea anthophila]TPV30159.1 hypothetical protein FJW00_04960 [Pantoea anthophila]
MAYENGLHIKLKSELRNALVEEANKQGISAVRLAAKILDEHFKLTNSANGDQNAQIPNGTDRSNRQ